MPQLIAQDGTQYPITGSVTTIGRENCDIILPQDSLISRRHAKIERRGGNLVISDMDSSNGTFVNGSRLQAPHTLQTGDTIRVGSTSLTVQGAGGAPPTRMINEPPQFTPAPPAQSYSPPPPSHSVPGASPSRTQKPSQIQTIAVMCMVDGILNILWSITLAGGLIATLAGIICVPIAIYPFVLGILEIIYSSKLMADPPNVDAPAQYLAIMQIANILVGDIISLIIGIISLVLYNDSQVQAYFASLGSNRRMQGSSF